MAGFREWEDLRPTPTRWPTRNIRSTVRGARAATSSDLTHSLGPTDEREASGSLASAETTRLSAKAACPHTNGSGFESAEVRTGTASGDPQWSGPGGARRARTMPPCTRLRAPCLTASVETHNLIVMCYPDLPLEPA